jgi:galactokinase
MIHPAELRPFFPLKLGEPRAFFAPGRVNLIGEHTDYNDGFVLPVALDLGITVLAARRNDRMLHVTSCQGNDAVEVSIDLDAPGAALTGTWRDYIAGIAQTLIHADYDICGAELLLASDLPTGAGLSSSAALEISVGFALLAIANVPIDLVKLALMAQAAEHHWVGTRCGIMDQLASACARENAALFIDCRSVAVKHVPLTNPSLSILVADTRVKHFLANSAYNARRHECERAVSHLRVVLPHIHALRDVSPDDFAKHGHLLSEVLARRVRHVVTENERVRQIVGLLEECRYNAMGELLVASHRSLQHDYEVSCRELDLLVDVAIQQRGVFGARMTGGGFGGSIVCLVETQNLGTVKNALSAAFNKEFDQSPGFFETSGGRGVCEIR